jgi:hypothetical protein
MILVPLALLALQQAPPSRPALPTTAVQPVLSFPDAGLDDTAAYRGYQTRFYRDAARNTLQTYIDQRSARVVHLLADADNASVGFTVRDGAGQVPALQWGDGARIATVRRTRSFEHQLRSSASTVHLGWFLLGSMRVERDFQYEERARQAFSAAPYALPDVDRLVAALRTLPTSTRALNASSIEAVRARLYPRVALRTDGTAWSARVQQVTLDARDTLTLEVRGDPGAVAARVSGDSLTLTSRTGGGVVFTVRVTTTARTLTPLTREQIFTPDFLTFLAETKARGARAAETDTAAIRARRMERQVRGVELLVSREKLMAGLPTYATYFGRDMLMTALMMRPIWQHETLEAVIATALRKLGPHGEVSHEEALGDQAVRESAAEYAALVQAHHTQREAGNRRAADSLLLRAGTVLKSLRVTRENYHMIDDEYQLAIVIARWITDPSVSAADKRAFLAARGDRNRSRLTQLLQELALVAQLTAPYVNAPVPANLISFAPREPTGWATASWRDSGAGYAGGRYAMDINAIWVPHALESIGQILNALTALEMPVVPASTDSSALARYARDPAALQRAITAWRGAANHFIVRRTADEVRAATLARVADMPEAERAWWQSRASTAATISDSLTFLDVALDASGRTIGVANTDPATALFLGDAEDPATAAAIENRDVTLRDVRLFARPYPAGLFVDRIGPVVANDAYASSAVWSAFAKDPYHGPRVVWGREVNLFLLGVAGRIRRAEAAGGAQNAGYVTELRAALEKVRTAVEQSGFHTELWSYGFERGQLGAMRYGSGADIQLWSTTDLAVQYELARMRR